MHTPSKLRFQLALVTGIVIAMLTGCGASVQEIPVSGQVLVDGQPLTYGYVQIVPKQARPSTAELDSNGEFTMICYGGAEGSPPGACQVAVIALEEVSPTQQRWHAPQHYGNASSSGLTANIVEPISDLRFELTSGGIGPHDVIGGSE